MLKYKEQQNLLHGKIIEIPTTTVSTTVVLQQSAHLMLTLGLGFGYLVSLPLIQGGTSVLLVFYHIVTVSSASKCSHVSLLKHISFNLNWK